MRRLLFAGGSLLSIAVSVFACRGADTQAPTTPTTSTVGATTAPLASEAPPVQAAPASEPVLVVADPRVLSELQASDLDFGVAVNAPGAATGAELAKGPGYRAIMKAIADDLAADRAKDPSAGVGMRFSHRQFDARWLSSEKTTFKLIAVVNRLDRHAFAPSHCGEARLVYRLGYRTQTSTGVVESELPMTANVVFFVDPGVDRDCAAAARAWLRPGPEGEPRDEARRLLAGPLSPARRNGWVRKSVEVNFQSVRWPSTVRPSMAGHAEYVLRVFHPVAEPPYLSPSPLENTPDVARLSRDRSLAGELSAWLRTPASLSAIEAGVATIPEKFLAQKAVSVSPHGLARGANRPFSSLFAKDAFAGLDLSSYPSIRSPAALLRRMDAVSCQGCHQSRSIAGFHLLGVDAADDQVDAVEVPMSPHFHADLARRREYVLAVAEGRPPDERRPPPERGARDDGVGARCGLGAGFSEWICAKGLRCVETTEPDVGVCLPEGGPSVGDACETGRITPNADPRRDSARLGAPTACVQDRPCEANSVGFPDGMCAGACSNLPEGAVCGGIALLDEFNACLGRGVAFNRCIAENTRPGALRACDFHSPCRDDYVCARVKGKGACMPPYFLFQLRVDGHSI